MFLSPLKIFLLKIIIKNNNNYNILKSILAFSKVAVESSPERLLFSFSVVLLRSCYLAEKSAYGEKK